MNYEHRHHKYGHTLCILASSFNTGMTNAMCVSTMVDMEYVLDTSLAQISYGLIIGSISFLIGCSFGFLYDYVDRHTVLVVATTLCAVSFALTPHSVYIYHYYTCLFLVFFSAGVWDSCQAHWLCELWGTGSAPLMQMVYVMIGLGGIAGPLLVKPYLTGKANTASVASNEDIVYSSDRQTKLKTPFMIGGAVIITVPVVLYALKYAKISGYRPVQCHQDGFEDSPILTDQTNRLQSKAKLIFISLFSISFFAFFGLQDSYINYMSIYYQSLPMIITAQKTSQIFSTFFATQTLGQLMSAVISTRLKPEVIIGYHLVILFLSLFVIHFGNHCMSYIWIGNVMFGFGNSGISGAYYSLADSYVKLTEKINAISSMLATLGSIIPGLVMGAMVEKHPDALIYVEFFYISFTIVLFLMILSLIKNFRHVSN